MSYLLLGTPAAESPPTATTSTDTRWAWDLTAHASKFISCRSLCWAFLVCHVGSLEDAVMSVGDKELSTKIYLVGWGWARHGGTDSKPPPDSEKTGGNAPLGTLVTMESILKVPISSLPLSILIWDYLMFPRQLSPELWQFWITIPTYWMKGNSLIGQTWVTCSYLDQSLLSKAGRYN